MAADQPSQPATAPTAATARAASSRDLHDLSLSPRDVARDSLVTNMLLSLDQLSLAQSPPPRHSAAAGDDDDEIAASASAWHPRTKSRSNTNRRAQGSNPRRQATNEASRRQTSRRGSSASRPRKDSYDGRAAAAAVLAEMSRDRPRGRKPNAYSRDSHAKGRRPSDDSDGQPGVEADRLPDGIGQQLDHDLMPRPSSSDYGSPPFPPPPRHSAVSSPQRITSNDLSAAPMPNIPKGPRREPSSLSIYPPRPSQAERSSFARRSPIRPTGRMKRTNDHHLHAAAAATAAMVAEFDSAPAPSVGYRKAKEQNLPAATAPAHVKEKPSFFRRVFGGVASRNHNTSAHTPSKASSASEPSPSSSAATSHKTTESATSARSRRPSHSSRPAAVSPPLADPIPAPSSNPPVLQKKKSSSFFRRLKKPHVEDLPSVDSVEEDPFFPTLGSPHLASEPSSTAVLPTHDAHRQLAAGGLLATSPSYPLRHSTGLGLTGLGGAAVLSENMNLAHGVKVTLSRSADQLGSLSPGQSLGPEARIRLVQTRNEEQGFRHAAHLSQGPPKPHLAVRDASFLDLEEGSDERDDSHHRSSAARNRRSRDRSDSRSQSAASSRDDEDRDSTIRARKHSALALAAAASASITSLSAPVTRVDRASSPAAASIRNSDRVTLPAAHISAPSLRIEGNSDLGLRPGSTLGTIQSGIPLDSYDLTAREELTHEDRKRAQKIFDGGEGLVAADKAAAWLGDEGPVRQRTLRAFMDLFSFAGQSILAALRKVCGRLVLRAETQQVDRILVAFSKRWCTCNPNHGFKSMDVIHMICYSVMLLNTDLHLADIEQKMTRGQFVKNTMTTIAQAVRESAPDAFSRPSILPGRSPLSTSENTFAPPEGDRSNPRHSLRQLRANSQGNDCDDCGPLVKSPFTGSMKAWEEQVEIVLKNVYTAIRGDRLPLYGAENSKPTELAPSQSSLSVISYLKRSPSVMSKAPSETQLSTRGRVLDGSRNATGRWTSKSRTRQAASRHAPSSSRTSFDDANSLWSPAMSTATWSRYSLGRGFGNMSQDSSMPRGDYQQSIGFANALSQAIIRDEDAHGKETAPSVRSADGSVPAFLEDESLELAGPPWMKEGMVVHKHHLDGVDKRAKDRNWSEVFAVVQKGQMSLFSFTSTRSMRQKARSKKPKGPVGGGNWQDNAVALGTFNLQLTLASALPPPGYSKKRPHVWALSLPTGAVHLFQVGTAEIIREFVNTVNYWSARFSSHPLIGGISNVEYGWSDAIVSNVLGNAADADSPPSRAADARSLRPTSRATHGRKSSPSNISLRPSLDASAGESIKDNVRGPGGRLPGDCIHIAEWAPPAQSMRASHASEPEQVEILEAYVRNVEEELQAHNRLRGPMLLAFSARGQNGGKARANWERKSAYLLREIVKFSTYLDCLQQAEAKKKVYSERDQARSGAAEASKGTEEDPDETLKP